MLEQKKPVKSLLRDEDGAVTVDYVLIVAAVAFLSIPALVAINAAVDNGTDNVAADLEAAAQQ